MKNKFMMMIAVVIMLSIAGFAYGFTTTSSTCPLEGTPECPKINCPLAGTTDCPYDQETVKLSACCKLK